MRIPKVICEGVIFCLMLASAPAEETPASSSLFVVDMINNSDGMDTSKDGRPPILTYQGVVNKSKPRLFLVFKDADWAWLAYLKETRGLEYIELDSVWDAFTEPSLRRHCDRAVVYDSRESKIAQNVAVTRAGQIDALALDAAIEADFKRATEAPCSFEIAEDYRGKWTGEGAEEASQAWAYAELFRNQQGVNPDVYGISPGNWGHVKGLDYIVQQKMFCWDIDAEGRTLADSETTQKAILSEFPPMTQAYGWWTKEVKDIDRMSQFGHIFFGHGFNDSVFSHFKVQPNSLKQKTSPDIVDYDPEATYIFITLTQGDNTGWSTVHNIADCLARSEIPGEEGRIVDRFPFGMMHGTPLGNMTPIIPEYFYRGQTANLFFTAKGYGYASPTVLEENGHLDAYIEKSIAAMKAMDIRDLMVNDPKTEDDPSHAIVRKLCREIKPRSIVFKHQLHPEAEEDDPFESFHGVPVFGDPVFQRQDKEKKFDLDATVEAIKSNPRKFFWVFMRAFGTAQQIEEIAERLAVEAPHIKILSPDQWIRLWMREADKKTAKH